MEANRHRETEVIGVAQDGGTGDAGGGLAAEVAPAGTSAVALLTVRDTFRGQEAGAFLAVPFVRSAQAETPVMVLGEFERVVRRASLRGREVEDAHRFRRMRDGVGRDGPAVDEGGDRLRAAQVVHVHLGFEAAVDFAGPKTSAAVPLFFAFLRLHVPEVSSASQEDGLCKGRPDAVVVWVVGRVVAGHDSTGG